MAKVCILTNYVMPYRHKLFSELSKNVNLLVVTCQLPSDDGRKDNFAFLDSTKYNYLPLKRVKIGKLALNYNIVELFNLVKMLRAFDYIIVNDNLPNILTNWLISTTLKIKNKKKPKIILWSEDYEYDAPYLSKNKKLLRKFFIDKIKHIIDCIIVFNKSDYLSLSLKLDLPVFFVPQAVSFKEEVINFTPKSIRFHSYGYMGYVKQRKNVDLLLNYFNQTKNIKLLIAGDSCLNSGNIKYLGYLKSESEKDSFFKNIDFLILPSFYDCWGLVVNEAGHRGVPTIISKYVKASEVVAKIDNNLIFNPYEKDSFDKVIRYSYLMSDDQYFEISKQFKAHFENYTIEKAVENFLNVFKSIQ